MSVTNERPRNVIKHWSEYISHLERLKIEHAQDYARHHSNAYVSGHHDIMLIAHLVDLLEQYDRAFIGMVRTPVIQQVAWDEVSKGWRDLITGVRVKLQEPSRTPPDPGSYIPAED